MTPLPAHYHPPNGPPNPNPNATTIKIPNSGRALPAVPCNPNFSPTGCDVTGIFVNLVINGGVFAAGVVIETVTGGVSMLIVSPGAVGGIIVTALDAIDADEESPVRYVVDVITVRLAENGMVHGGRGRVSLGLDEGGSLAAGELVVWRVDWGGFEKELETFGELRDEMVGDRSVKEEVVVRGGEGGGEGSCVVEVALGGGRAGSGGGEVGGGGKEVVCRGGGGNGDTKGGEGVVDASGAGGRGVIAVTGGRVAVAVDGVESLVSS